MLFITLGHSSHAVTNATVVRQETNATVTTVVGSPVLAATVGLQLNFSKLEEPVSIFLRLNELGVSDRNVYMRGDCILNVYG